jgi:acyl CoA:acetate/3-ketoacid CoA transferase alpha subunit
MATAAKYVIAEVDEIVDTGALSPEEIVTPHLFVNAIVLSKKILTKEGVVTR